MENLKALFIVVNAGCVDEAMSIAREEGAGGATILNARGNIAQQSFMGITVDAEREIILCLVPKDVATKIMVAIEEKAGMKSNVHGACFVLPVEMAAGLNVVRSGDDTQKQ